MSDRQPRQCKTAAQDAIRQYYAPAKPKTIRQPKPQFGTVSPVVDIPAASMYRVPPLLFPLPDA